MLSSPLRSRVAIAIGVLAVGLTSAGVAGAGASTQWKVVPSPNAVGGQQDFLDSVAAASSTNAWAVGDYDNGTARQTLIEHWNGKAWRVVPSPDPGGPSNDNYLFSVVARPSTGAWAVGFYSTGAAQRTLVERWNGTAWKVVPSPNAGPASDNDVLNAAVAISSRDVLAVGDYSEGAVTRTLVERWDGTAWRIVRSANAAGSSESVLNAVAASSSKDVWAVGERSNGTSQRSLVERWNGTAWKVVPSPNAGAPTNANFLNSVVPTSSTGAWAVGDYFLHSNSTGERNLIERWNGKVWKVVSAPDPGGISKNDGLNAVAVTPSAGVWAVGDYYYHGAPDRTLVERWNGNAWAVVPSANAGGSSGSNALNGVVATSSGGIWAVGAYFTSAYRTLVERWTGKA